MLRGIRGLPIFLTISFFPKSNQHFEAGESTFGLEIGDPIMDDGSLQNLAAKKGGRGPTAFFGPKKLSKFPYAVDCAISAQFFAWHSFE